MKKRRNILSVCLAMLLVFSMATPAMAVVSSKDKSSLSKAQQSAVQKATNDFNNAKSRGDTAGMAAAHAAAEAVRNSAGYSGGSTGSGSTSKSSSSKVDGTTHSSASNASDYNKEAGNTASSGNYSSTGHTAKDQQNMAGLSNADTETIAWLEDLYSASSKSGDAATANAAHSAAEALRNAYGYSGGADGGYYYKDNSGNPGKSTPSGSSGSGGGGTSAGNYTFYSISASAGAGGSISPNGTTTLVKGDSKTYSVTPSSGYKISSVKVDGASVGAVSSYTFSNITSGHTISAEFASNASVSVGGATLGDGGSGTLKSGNATKSGYGVTANVSVAASYVSDVTVTASYSFTSAKTVSLENVGGAWQFPVNGTSVTGARKIYIPVETPDGTYTITFLIKALDPQATALTGSNVYLTATKSVTLTIKGSMYEDDFTGNS